MQGRVHRVLFHWLLRRRQSIPQPLAVPVSARLLASRARYFDALKECQAGVGVLCLGVFVPACLATCWF